MREAHPFGDYFSSQTEGMLIGSFPIGKFTDPLRSLEIKAHEWPFFFGGEKNLLWKLLSSAFKQPLTDVPSVKHLLEAQHLGVADVISSCERKSGGASDSDLLKITFNTGLLQKLRDHHVHTVFFTSRRVEQWFHQIFPDTPELQKINLISPSAQTLRGLGSSQAFKKWRAGHPEQKAMDFIYQDYEKIFTAWAQRDQRERR